MLNYRLNLVARIFVNLRVSIKTESGMANDRMGKQDYVGNSESHSSSLTRDLSLMSLLIGMLSMDL